VDIAGHAYVTGYTASRDFPTTANALQSQPLYHGTILSYFSQPNAFVAELNATGTALVYSTYLGGGGDVGAGIAVDGVGNAYVTGSTTSFDFPTTAGAWQRDNHDLDILLNKGDGNFTQVSYDAGQQ
jgi:Beta-propeller repeat